VRALRKLEKTKEMLKELGVNLKDYSVPENRKPLPVSVKTRLGFIEHEIETWIPKLLEMQPAAISLHGRTFKQLYSGDANWEVIGAAAKLVHAYNAAHPESDPVLILGNGDVNSREKAFELAKQYNVDGVLIGRATWGDPWVFLPKEQKPAEQDWNTKVPVILEHARIHFRLFPKQFVSIRKHLAWYFHGFDGASEMRQRMVRTNSADEVENIISSSNILTR
jgi:tRNA-dihydrouridine synthase B